MNTMRWDPSSREHLYLACVSRRSGLGAEINRSFIGSLSEGDHAQEYCFQIWVAYVKQYDCGRNPDFTTCELWRGADALSQGFP